MARTHIDKDIPLVLTSTGPQYVNKAALGVSKGVGCLARAKRFLSEVSRILIARLQSQCISPHHHPNLRKIPDQDHPRLRSQRLDLKREKTSAVFGRAYHIHQCGSHHQTHCFVAAQHHHLVVLLHQPLVLWLSSGINCIKELGSHHRILEWKSAAV